RSHAGAAPGWRPRGGGQRSAVRRVRATPRGVAAKQGVADTTDAWWARHDAERMEVASRWGFKTRADFEAVLRLEFPAGVANPWLADHPEALGLTYHYVLFAVRKPA